MFWRVYCVFKHNCQMWWHIPVIPASWKAKAGEWPILRLALASYLQDCFKMEHKALSWHSWGHRVSLQNHKEKQHRTPKENLINVVQEAPFAAEPKATSFCHFYCFPLHCSFTFIIVSDGLLYSLRELVFYPGNSWKLSLFVFYSSSSGFSLHES